MTGRAGRFPAHLALGAFYLHEKDYAADDRELALARMRDFGTTCRDVRTREVGIVEHHTNVRPDEVRCFFFFFF